MCDQLETIMQLDWPKKSSYIFLNKSQGVEIKVKIVRFLCVVPEKIECKTLAILLYQIKSCFPCKLYIYKYKPHKIFKLASTYQ